MRHRINKLTQLNTWAKKKDVFVKILLSNLVRNWKITTTPKRAKVLKAEADSFFSKLLRTYSRYSDENEARRECINLVKTDIYGEDEGKKVVNVLLPKYLKDKPASFVASYRMWFRKWDAAEKVMLKLL